MALRDVTADDLPVFFEHQREPAACRIAEFLPRDHPAFMTHWRTQVLGDSSVNKQTIVVDGDVAGNILSWEQDGKRLIGYWIGSGYWGRGVATAALAAFLADHERTRPVYAYVTVQNAGSRRVLEKCGFRQVGEAVTGPDGCEEVVMQLGIPAPKG